MVLMTQSTTIKTRFAPSPSGDLHLGHAYSAKLNYDFANEHGGEFVLRIEDIDHLRCKPKFEQSIFDDLSWLGLKWQTPVRRQSEHFAEYAKALQKLDDLDILYPCFCTRKKIREEIEDSNRAPHLGPKRGPEGLIYPGICRKFKYGSTRQQFLRKASPMRLGLICKKH